MSRTTRHARPAREHAHVVVTCAYADRVGERLRARPGLRITPVRRDPHSGATAGPFVVVEFEDEDGAGVAAAYRATSARLRSLAGDPRALGAFARKVLDHP